MFLVSSLRSGATLVFGVVSFWFGFSAIWMEYGLFTIKEMRNPVSRKTNALLFLSYYLCFLDVELRDPATSSRVLIFSVLSTR